MTQEAPPAQGKKGKKSTAKEPKPAKDVKGDKKVVKTPVVSGTQARPVSRLGAPDNTCAMVVQDATSVLLAMQLPCAQQEAWAVFLADLDERISKQKRCSLEDMYRGVAKLTTHEQRALACIVVASNNKKVRNQRQT